MKGVSFYLTCNLSSYIHSFTLNWRDEVIRHIGLLHAANKELMIAINEFNTVGRINFEDKKFRGFRGYLLNLEIKYPCNFLYTRSRFFVQHVHVVGKWLALWKYFKRATEVKTSLPSPTGSLYQATFKCRAATIRKFSA